MIRRCGSHPSFLDRPVPCRAQLRGTGQAACFQPGAPRVGRKFGQQPASSSGTIGENSTSGATVHASLIAGLNDTYGSAVSGSDIFVSNYASGPSRKNTTSGATVNASLVSGPSYPAGIAVTDVAVPEPASLAVLTAGLFGLVGLRGDRRSAGGDNA